MGSPRHGLILLAVAACGRGSTAPSNPPPPADLGDQVVADFEKAVLTSKEAFQDLFDFTAVGKFEKLLHRYDLMGRAELTPEQDAAWRAETAEPFSSEREHRNVGNFYARFVQRTVGTGGCRRVEPGDEYAVALTRPFEDLPPEYQAWEPMRQEINAMIENGGNVGLVCNGGKGGITLVYTKTAEPRGYRLIAVYDDWGLGDE